MNFFFYILPVFIILSAPLYSQERVSAGVTAGYHYDAGNFSGKQNFDGTVQQNISAGAVFKLDFNFIFLRSGAEFSYPFIKGKYGGNIDTTDVYFVEVPLYAGLNLPIRNFGAFYMGAGGSYIFGSGDIKTSSGKVDISEQLFGYGFIAGIESEIHNSLSFIMEWGYVSAKSSPLAVFDPTDLYDDYYIDFTGHRIRAGFLYHFSSY